MFLAFLSTFSFTVNAQVLQRPRLVQPTSTSRPTTQPISQANLVQTTSSSRPTLTNDIRIADSYINQTASLIRKTVDSKPTASAVTTAVKYAVSPAAAAFNQKLSQAMDSKLGIPYRYGATGLKSIDCSGLVWMVFQEAGISFERSSAANYWREFEPVTGDERFRFGTLVFFNSLGHVGIVVNEKGFYHASSSKGVTYSSFDGYWGKRIVGYRRIPTAAN
jgi:cell wall-associated NlpC family hydrolase